MRVAAPTPPLSFQNPSVHQPSELSFRGIVDIARGINEFCLHSYRVYRRHFDPRIAVDGDLEMGSRILSRQC